MANNKVKSNTSASRFFRRTGFYALISFMACFAVLMYINSLIHFGNSDPVSGGANLGVSVITGVPEDARDISFSYDDKYVAYMYNSQIFVKDLKTNGTAGTITDSNIVWSLLMNDRDKILYFTQDQKKDMLTVWTYDIENKASIKQLSFDIPSNSKIKAVDYSNATSLIYLNLEQTKNSGKTTDTIYSINIMKNLQKISSNNMVENMVLLNNSGSLYFEDNDNNLYNRVKQVVDLQTGHLIGCDSKDNVYVQSIEDKSSISVISGSEVVKTLTLPDTNYIGFYSDKSNVYVIYSDYIINLSGNMSAKFTYDENLTFVGLGGSNIYFRDSDKNIVALASSILI